MSFFLHPQGICDSADVGDGTRIWAFAHVLAGARIGRDCNICDHVFVENDVIVGDRVTVKCGVQLWDGLRVGDDVFVGPNATFSNDKFPRSKAHQETVVPTRIANGASIGANATVLPGLSIGAGSMVGAGAVVTSDVPAKAIVSGSPARITGYVDAVVQPRDRAGVPPAHLPGSDSTTVAGVKIHSANMASDLRGSLVAVEFGRDVPFAVRRSFVIYDVPSKDVRGAHAHRECEQFLVCVKGETAVVVDDGRNREEILLDRPEIGVHIPRLVWATQYKFTPDAVLLVFASEHYDPDDYIRDYDEFLSEVAVDSA